ncbi:MAG: FAD-binding oxidoreductase [archaeon]|nr:FAD-binding oxidoreductase [archaeon]
MKDIVFQNLIDEIKKICGNDSFSAEQQLLKKFSYDESLVSPKIPILIVWPKNTDEIMYIIKLANKFNVFLITVSSNHGFRQYGDTVPKLDNTMIIDLSKMNKIIRIDRKNRVVMIEPGVTFKQLIHELKKNDLRPLIPLHPKKNKSVLSSALGREAQTIPRFHWDAVDPLLCIEVVFGNGEIFRTGAAAGPGTLEEQWESGQAQKNPMGPTQFSINRTIQGSQGTMGIVSWASIKCELIPTKQKILYISSNNLQELINFLQKIVLRYRFGDEVFLMNKNTIATLSKEKSEDILTLIKKIKKEWILTIVLSGRHEFAEDKIQYMKDDLSDYIKNYSLELELELEGINNEEILKKISSSCEKPWVFRQKGNCEKIFFISSLDRSPDYISIAKNYLKEMNYNFSDLGIYIQPLVQGSNCHLEFQLFYDPTNENEVNMVKKIYHELSEKLVSNGAFFSRPYGEWSSLMYKNLSEDVIEVFHKLKNIFDPNNILNPNSLCFTSEFNYNGGKNDV